MGISFEHSTTVYDHDIAAALRADGELFAAVLIELSNLTDVEVRDIADHLDVRSMDALKRVALAIAGAVEARS